MWKYALAFIGGCGIGVAASYKLLEKKFKDISDSEIESVKKYYKSKEAAQINEAAKLATKLAESSAEATNHPENAPLEAIKESVKQQAGKEEGYYDYTSFFNGAAPKDVEHTEGSTNKKIFPISNQEWDRDLRHDKIQLTWYQGDATLADGDDRIISVEETVGKIGDLEFGKYGDDVAYCRNEETMTDYMVFKEYCSFTDVVDYDEDDD